MDYKARYNEWLNDSYFDAEDRAELAALKDEKEIEDRFYRDLEFGTAGMRGVMGMGSNRMNKYNIRKATAAFALALKEKHGEEACAKQGVAVAWVSRNNSQPYAYETAMTFAAYGIPAKLYTLVSATPLLSFTVRDLNCVGGVVVTASHNPKEYNGYKAYDETGCQVLTEDANAITKHYEELSYKEIKSISEAEAREKGLLKDLGMEEMQRFIDAVAKTANPLPQEAKDAIKIVYTPLFGAGLVPVLRILDQQGYKNVSLVESQKGPDGNFPGLAAPNPEFAEAMMPGIEQAKAEGADIVIGSDPDSDRMGLAARDEKGEFVLFTGNQIGTLLLNYLIERRKDKLPKDVYFVSSIVSTQMSFAVAKENGVRGVATLTGYKYIGEQMTKDPEDFLFAFEESYGFLSGTYARDKDAVFAALLLSEMAAYYKALQKPLTAVLSDLYARYGYFLDKVDSYTLKGKDGAQSIKNISARMRAAGTGLMDGIEEMLDYKDGMDGMPPADVLRFRYADGSWLAVRPSGTEPKIKFYYSIKAKDQADAEKLYQLRKAVSEQIVKEESL